MLGNRFDSLLDVTIVYPDGAPTFWHFLRGDVKQVIVRVERRAIPPEFSSGADAANPLVRKQVKGWLHEMWQRKDEQIAALLRAPG